MYSFRRRQTDDWECGFDFVGRRTSLSGRGGLVPVGCGPVQAREGATPSHPSRCWSCMVSVLCAHGPRPCLSNLTSRRSTTNARVAQLSLATGMKEY